MKPVLYIFSLLCLLLVSVSAENTGNSRSGLYSGRADTTGCDEAPGQKEKQFILAADSENSLCLTPRTLQVNSNPVWERVSKNASRQLLTLKLKEHNTVRKTREAARTLQTVYYSSFLTATGYRIFALRKIII